MNIQIQQLKQQAGLSDDTDQTGLNIFADLLIKECAKIADCPSSFKHKHGYKILRHFDIKETV
jgi:hypothetical protein